MTTDTPLSAVDEIAQPDHEIVLALEGLAWIAAHQAKGVRADMERLIDTLRTRISSLEASGEVAVKELEWKLIGRAWIAETDIGDYEVSVFELEGVSTRLITPFDRTGVWFRTDKDAKAAAQADFSRRIRSALVPQPAVPDPSPAPEEPGEASDFTIDDALAARDVLQYLGIGDDASLEPSDRRRNKIAAIIRARVDAAIEALANKERG